MNLFSVVLARLKLTLHCRCIDASTSTPPHLSTFTSSHAHIRRSTSPPHHTHTSAHLYHICTSTLSLLHICPVFLSFYISFLSSLCIYIFARSHPQIYLSTSIHLQIYIAPAHHTVTPSHPPSLSLSSHLFDSAGQLHVSLSGQPSSSSLNSVDTHSHSLTLSLSPALTLTHTHSHPHPVTPTITLTRSRSHSNSLTQSPPPPPSPRSPPSSPPPPLDANASRSPDFLLARPHAHALFGVSCRDSFFKHRNVFYALLHMKEEAPKLEDIQLENAKINIDLSMEIGRGAAANVYRGIYDGCPQSSAQTLQGILGTKTTINAHKTWNKSLSDLRFIKRVTTMPFVASNPCRRSAAGASGLSQNLLMASANPSRWNSRVCR